MKYIRELIGGEIFVCAPMAYDVRLWNCCRLLHSALELTRLDAWVY